nr:putative Ig domain-containing protein [uncultured Rhodopila sp.]
MAVSLNANAFVNASAASISLSQIVSVNATGSNPAYLVLTALDRNEYTAGASGATGSFSGNGHVLSFSSIGGDGRGAGIVFAYQVSTGRYYNSTYGYLDQLTYNASGSLDDVTNLSLYALSSSTLPASYISNDYLMMQVDPSGFLGSATVVTEKGYTGTVPSQATPNSIAVIADSFVGQSWNMTGCWVLASTIAAEAGASLPVQSTAIGVPGQANGEWIVAYNGPAGQSGNWQSMVTAGEIIVIGTGGGSGHITTCVSGSGSSAMLVDNIVYENYLGQITNPANDGSANDVIVAAPHLASQEWSGVQQSSVVIYELDTPTVTALVSSDRLTAGGSQLLGSLFQATDPVAGKTIQDWQIYDTASGDSFAYGSGQGQFRSAASALTTASLSSVSLLAGSGSFIDTLEVRAFNGSYWGDWTALSVSVVSPQPPVLNAQTAAQTWVAGRSINLALAPNTFTDPLNLAMTYKATLANGQALPAWLTFNAATETFTGTAPTGNQALSIVVTATDSNGLSVSETISASVVNLPKLAIVTLNQMWNRLQGISLALPGGTFIDPQGQALTYNATLFGGQALPNWLAFNPVTETFSGVAPNVMQTLNIVVTATDSLGLSASETFAATVVVAPKLVAATPNQTWVEGRAVSFALPTGTFTDPQGEKLSYAAALVSGQALPGWLTFNVSTGTFTGTAPASAQTLSIGVTATNTSGLSVSETVSVAVMGAPVVAAPTASQAWKAGQAVSLALPTGTFTDPQGQTLTYTAALAAGQALPGWLTFSPATETFSGTAPASAQTLSILVTATDSSGLATSETIAATVIGAPTVAAATPGQLWIEGKAISLALPTSTFADPQGQKLSYSAKLSGGQALPGWLTFNAASETFTGTAPSSYQTLSILVTATNSSGLSVAETISVAVAAPPAVTLPTAGQTWKAGQGISLALAGNTFTDPQGQALTYKATLASGQALPSWLTFNAATDTFTGTAPAGAQKLSILVTATDSLGLSVSETIAATVIGAPVVAAATGGQVWTEGKSLSLALPAGTFTDPQGQTLTYKAALASGQALPGWLTFNAATETFSGTAPGTYQTLSIVVTATNSSGLSAYETIAATIAGTPVVSAATPSQTWRAAQAFSLALPSGAFTDPQRLNLTYKAALANGQALPGWLTFNAATDTFSGTAPSAAQTLGIVVTATDSLGLSVSETISATIIGVPVVAAATATQVWTEGKAFSLALPGNAFTDPQGQKLTYTAALANGQTLPGWLTFKAATDTFSGTAPSTYQTLSVVVTATNTSGLSASETISAVIAAPPKLAIATASQSWTEAKAFSLALPGGTFTDPQGQAMTYKAVLSNGQALPSWLKFNAATDTFSGTAPSTAQSLGITVTATNSSGLSASESFTATVAPPSAGAAKAMIISIGSATGVSAISQPGAFVAVLAASPAPLMGFIAGDGTAPSTAFSAATGYYDLTAPVPPGMMPFAEPPAGGWNTPAAELFSVPPAAAWPQSAAPADAAAFGPGVPFDPHHAPGLIAFPA